MKKNKYKNLSTLNCIIYSHMNNKIQDPKEVIKTLSDKVYCHTIYPWEKTQWEKSSLRNAHIHTYTTTKFILISSSYSFLV